MLLLKGKLLNSMVNKGARIFGRVEHSVIFYGVQIEEGAVVRDSVLMPNVIVGKNCRIDKAIICQNTEIGAGAQISSDPKSSSISTDDPGITVIGGQKTIAENKVITAGEVQG